MLTSRAIAIAAVLTALTLMIGLGESRADATHDPTAVERHSPYGRQAEIPLSALLPDDRKNSVPLVEELAPVSVEQMAEDFRRVAFAVDAEMPIGLIKKWTVPIRYHVVGERDASIDWLVDTLFEYIEDWTALDIQDVPLESSSRNFTIAFFSSKNMMRVKDKLSLYEYRSCTLGFNRESLDGQIKTIFAYIDHTLPEGEQVACIIRKLFVAMGLGETRSVSDTVVDMRRFPTVLPKDKKFLQILYSQHIDAGDRWGDIKENVRKIIIDNKMYGRLSW